MNFKSAVFAAFLVSVMATVPVDAQSIYSPDGKYRYPSQEKIDRQVDSVFRKLSTREKIAQIMVIDFTSRDSEEQFAIQKRLIKREKVGGLIPLGDLFFPAMNVRKQLFRPESKKWFMIVINTIRHRRSLRQSVCLTLQV